ncbi:hypothetical protein [Methanolobus halotolerans]|uniref:Uncharacterized protein n=1 Tax=Methanolobus halotolerans TaxID=2052935 RepID=A0A4E0PVY7_9EURY|nr:hypothetical protein [Methanolobus halotolerans]TGC09424.1 hypothetical protein CUN85_06235 [Methanolobus halotolerans]
MSSTDDIRTQLALYILNYANGVYKIHKTTRAGATTSLVLACLILGIPVLILEPTNRIITQTVIADVKAISEKKDAIIIHVPSNFKCKLNKKMIKDNPDYGDFDFLPLPTKCAGDDEHPPCEYYEECPVTEIQRAEEFDVLCITYDKLVAIIKTAEMFPYSHYTDILEKIDKQVGVVILDEVHGLQYDKTSEINLFENDDKFASKFLDKIKKANKSDVNKFVILENVISNYQETINTNAINAAAQQLKNQFLFRNLENGNWFNYKHTRKAENTEFKDFFCQKEKYNPYKHEFETISIDQDNVTIESVAELMDLTAIRHEYNISMDEITAVFRILNTVTNKELIVKARKISEENKDDTLDFNIVAINNDFKKHISKFLQGMQYNKLNISGCDKKVTTTKIIFLTTATFGSYDYSQLFHPNTEIEDIIFGENGDPLRTNNNHYLFYDTKSFTSRGKYSVYNQRYEIRESCIDIMNIFGPEKCIIFCRNKDEYILFKDLFDEHYKDVEQKPFVTYYRSSESIGVKSHYRVGIHIGLAHIPSDSHDLSCDTVEESRILAEEQMHGDTWQAASRPKDPSGKEPSISIFLGVTERDVRNLSSWGVGRKPEIIPPEKKGMKKGVNVHIEGEKISAPIIIDTRDWEETLIMSVVCKYGLYSSPQTIEYYECNNLMNNSVKDELSVNSKADLLTNFFSDVKTQVKRKNRTFSKKDKILDEKIMHQHLSGDKNVYYHSSSRMTEYIMFESESEIHIGKLKLFFDTNNLPYAIEKLNNKYRVWIFSRKVNSLQAQLFGYNILKAVKFKTNGKNMECTMYPNTVKPKKKGSTEDLIQLPFGKHSQILHYGQFIDDFEMDIGIVDIMENDIYNTFKVQGLGKVLSMFRATNQQNEKVEA